MGILYRQERYQKQLSMPEKRIRNIMGSIPIVGFLMRGLLQES